MANNIDDLRTHLFDTLRGLTSKTQPLDIDRAKAVAEVAQTIINTAKVEVEYAKATGGKKTSAFLDADGSREDLPAGITGIRRHQLQG
jgi:hypothetical protein